MWTRVRGSNPDFSPPWGDAVAWVSDAARKAI